MRHDRKGMFWSRHGVLGRDSVKHNSEVEDMEGKKRSDEVFGFWLEGGGVEVVEFTFSIRSKKALTSTSWAKGSTSALPEPISTPFIITLFPTAKLGSLD